MRSLNNDAEPRGEALPEEEGVELSGFCGSQIDQIWSAFGLTHYYDGIVPFRVYSEAFLDTKTKPWWKFW